MTPAEQDKELRDLLIEIKFNIRKGDKVNGVSLASLPHIAQDIETYLKSDDATRAMQLITADRKRVALEAMLNEVQNAYEHWINGKKFISSYFRDRISELSGIKESADNE